MAARLDRVIDWLERGVIPKQQCSNSLYADLIEQPLDALRSVYRQVGLTLSADVEARMRQYVQDKPKGKFGRHQYGLGESEEVRLKRDYFRRYQQYFGVPDEAV
jgi:hypothetical protein